MLVRAFLVAILALAPSLASAADPYQWVGSTSVAFTGDGNGLGFVGMTTQCRADFGPGARMCKSEEVMDSDTLNLDAIPAVGCWLRPSWRPVGSAGGTVGLDESGAGASIGFFLGDPFIDGMTCFSWGGKGTDSRGLSLQSSGRIAGQSCAVARPVACCKPTPVPSPSASLSLRIGALTIAGLSVLRGAS